MSNTSNADKALQKLAEGNTRFVSSKLIHPNQGEDRRIEVSKGQSPFAIIVGCSDSRIPPEILFDQGLGDLFVIRVAGNILDDIGMGSIEYAVSHLGTELVVVLGHGKCGAVSATVQGGEPHGHIGSIVKAIAPALEKAKGLAGDLTDNTIRANVGLVAGQIRSSKPILSKMMEEGKVRVVGAYYNIESGKVEFI
ncbi:MAG: carbonic anhydrase [Syntrophus sp. (in: bacteria)]|nr:carbonic anhydrase [Syntrophus sp. (in: bacteria)]